MEAVEFRSRLVMQSIPQFRTFCSLTAMSAGSHLNGCQSYAGSDQCFACKGYSAGRVWRD